MTRLPAGRRRISEKPWQKAMIFNSLTTALAEVEKTHAELLNLPRFDYDALPADEKRFVDGLRKGGFVLEDAADEVKIVKFAYNSNKYDRMGLGFTVAPTLRCNFACTYCYEQAEENQDRRDGQNAAMTEAVQQELLKLVEQAAKTVKGVYITWYGGEPLLTKDIVFGLSEKIIAIAEENKIGYSAGMVTNGYLLAEDPDMVRKLKDSRINFVQITFDGPPDTHNRRRMLKGDVVRLTGRGNIGLLDAELVRRRLTTKEMFRWPLDRKTVERALARHNCFGRDVCISPTLEVYPCIMERRVSHGNLRETGLKALLKREICGLNKDKVEVCRDCEFRYACHDCRPDTLDGGVTAKPWYCTYDPYSGEWEAEEDVVRRILG